MGEFDVGQDSSPVISGSDFDNFWKQYGDGANSSKAASSLNKDQLKEGPGASSSQGSNPNGGFPVSVYKKVPTVILDQLKSKFNWKSTGISQTDYLVAYLYCIGDSSMKNALKPVLTEKQLILIDTFVDDGVVDLDKRMKSMESKMDAQSRQMDGLMMINAYHLMDRMVINSAPLVSSFDLFSGPGSDERDLIVDMIKKVDGDVKRMRMKRDGANGRAISRNVGNKKIQNN